MVIATGLPALREGDVRTFFELTETVSIDVAVLERADNVAAIEARFAWDDVGVWNAIARTRGVDERGNAVVGPGRVLDAEGNVVWAESRRVNAIGVADLLVMPLALAPDLKALRQRLEGGEPGPGEGA